MNRLTTSLLIAAASGAMIAGCTTDSTARGFASRNGPGQGECLAINSSPEPFARPASFNRAGQNVRMVDRNGPCPNPCMANGIGPGPRAVAATPYRNGRGPNAANANRGRGPGRGPGPGAGNANGFGPGQNGACCGVGNACAIPAGLATPVNEATADALRVTLEDELTARAFYAAILAKHGNVLPFTNIMQAEERHAEAIRTLMQRHQVDGSGVTARPLPEIPATIAQCARLAAQLERDNVAIYDRVVQTTTEPDIKTVFERLRGASLDNHLPAFERVAGM